MSHTNEQILEAVGSMTVMQLCELTRMLEEKFGVKASDAVQAPVQAPPPAPAQEEKTEFAVVLSEIGEKRVQVIKVLREVTGLGLMEANKATAAGAVVKEGLGKADAEALKAKFEAVGAKAELK